MIPESMNSHPPETEQTKQQKKKTKIYIYTWFVQGLEIHGTEHSLIFLKFLNTHSLELP